METKDVLWLPQEDALPKSFVTCLLGYLSPTEKGNLAETHAEWAKRIIRCDSGLSVAHVRSESVLVWAEVELARWEKLADTLENVPDRQRYDLVDLAWLCHRLLDPELPRDDGVWVVIDQKGQLQALATAESEEGADSHEIHELLTAPWNLWRRDNTNEPRKNLPSPPFAAQALWQPQPLP